MRVVVPLLLLALTVAGCLGDTPKDPAPPAEVPAGDVVRFIAVGDVGTGGESQYAVAAAMEAVCAARGCDLVLMLGDNIYNTGVDGPDDPQFQTKFEAPYADLDLPFYPVLGNHDYGGEGTGIELQKGQHQVDYSSRSDKWRMPAPYHDFQVGPVHFIALDSGPVTATGTPLAVPGYDLTGQDTWLGTALAGSTAAWNVTLAHHPYRSNGQHGDAGSFDGNDGQGVAWADLIESHCADIDLHLAGHDHDLQWLEPDPTCPGTQLVVSGAGANQRSQGAGTHPSRFQAFDTYGFVWVQATQDSLTLAFYDERPTLLHEGTVPA